jgi:hypothetical protein
MVHDDHASKGTEGVIGHAAGNVVEIDKRPLTRNSELKKGSGETPKLSRNNVVEIGKRSFFYTAVKKDLLKT